MNEALAQFLQGQALVDAVRDTIRATLQDASVRQA
jgi:hypothetical protein